MAAISSISYAGVDGNDVVLFGGTPETEVTIDGSGNLVVTDINGGNSADDLTMTFDGTYYTFNDPNLTLSTSGIAAGDLIRPDAFTVSVRATAVTGGLSIDMLAGTDVVNLDGDFTAPPATNVSVLADTINVNAAIATSTTGTIDLNGDIQVVVNTTGSLTTAAGALTLTGQAGPAGNSGAGEAGVQINGAVTSTTGTITIDGTSGATTALNNWGVLIDGATASVQSGGAINIDGQGGAGTDFNFGVYILNGATDETTGTGTLDITGTTLGTGLGNHGVAVQAGSTVQSTTANLSITGTAAGTGIDNRGVQIVGTVASLGAATVTITGTGSGVGTGANGADGVFLGSGQVNSAGGAIQITGTAGTLGNGVRVNSTGQINATNAATVELIGTAVGAGVGEEGISLEGPINSATGTVTLTSNDDIAFLADGDITSTAGTITVTADRSIAMSSGSSITSGAGAVMLDANVGGGAAGTFIGISLASATISSTDGAIALTGQGGNAGTNNTGIRFSGTSTVESTGTVAGTAGYDH